MGMAEPGGILCFDFFFQAEDGIRDTSVTGVQTCALPISGRARRVHHHTTTTASGASQRNAGLAKVTDRIPSKCVPAATATSSKRESVANERGRQLSGAGWSRHDHG